MLWNVKKLQVFLKIAYIRDVKMMKTIPLQLETTQ